MINATVGQFLVNDALPEDLRDYSRVLDGPGLKALLQNVARNHPEKYRDVSYKLNQVGLRSAQDQGGMSFGARHLLRSKVANEVRERIQGKLQQILSNDELSDKDRAEQIIKAVGSESMPQIKAVLEEAVQNKNPLGTQVMSGTRGKAMNLASLIASDMLYSDDHDEVIPIPVLRSYSEGLSPEEYWAGTYGARRGIMSTKFATQEAGFLSKQLNQAGHRLVVMGEDSDEVEDAPLRGMIADTDDSDNEGSLLAQDTGPYKKNTPLTPKILNHLKRLGKNRILVRSPIIGGSPEGGVYARDVGIREQGALPGRGEQVGLQAAQALSEPISQGQLSAKHSGGVAGQEKAVGGFQYINQLIQTPKKMQGGASHSTLDGRVQRIEPAPAGGYNVIIGGQQHYVADGFEVKVKTGDDVEAGDMISDGIPNPAVITQYKGVGEGRRYFVNEFRKAMANSGMRGHRRNIELLARGLINHVKLTEEMDDNVPDDVIPYSTLEHTYKPREGHETLIPKKAIGQYLERPVLHYTIGTKVRPSMLKDFEEFGVGNVIVHKNPPPFEPHMVRGMYQLQHDPDWLTQMYGSGLKQSLLESVARGAKSEARGTSFVSSLATGTDFGEVPDRAVIQPQKPYSPPNVPMPKVEEPAPIKMAFFGGKHVVSSKPFKKFAVSPTPPQTKAPANTTIPAPTINTPKDNPSSANDVFGNNIMPPSPTSVPTGATINSTQTTPTGTPVNTATPVAVPPPANTAQANIDATQLSRNQNYQQMNPEQYFNFQKNLGIMNNGFTGPSRQLATSIYGQKMMPFSQQGGLNYEYQPQGFSYGNTAATGSGFSRSSGSLDNVVDSATAAMKAIPDNPSFMYSNQTNQVLQGIAARQGFSSAVNKYQTGKWLGEVTRETAQNVAPRSLSWFDRAKGALNAVKGGLNTAGQGINWAVRNPIAAARMGGQSLVKAPLISTGVDAATAIMRPTEDILADYDAYGDRFKNINQGTNEFTKGLYNLNPIQALGGLGSATYNAGMFSLGAMPIIGSPIQAGQNLLYGPMVAGRNTEEGQSMRRNFAAESLAKDPKANEDIEGFKKDDRTTYQSIMPTFLGGKANPTDKRTMWQYTMPTALGGKKQKSQEQIQAPDVAQQITWRKTFDSMSQAQLEKFVNTVRNDKPEEGDDPNYFQNKINQLRPDQQEKFMQIAKRLADQENKPEEGSGDLSGASASGDF